MGFGIPNPRLGEAFPFFEFGVAVEGKLAHDGITLHDGISDLIGFVLSLFPGLPV
jgi:hypothetical protein